MDSLTQSLGVSMTNRRDFLRGAGAAVCAASMPLRAIAQEKRPNILVLITDQQSADTASYRMGTRYLHTPTEICEVADIEAIVQLVTAFARRLGRDTSFVR